MHEREDDEEKLKRMRLDVYMSPNPNYKDVSMEISQDPEVL